MWFDTFSGSSCTEIPGQLRGCGGTQTGMAELGLLEEDINEIHLPAFTASEADLHFLYQAKATAQMLILSCWLCSVLDLQENSK